MVPDWVSRYIGVPFVAGGESLEGADCQGLFALVTREQFGREIPAYGGPLWEGAESSMTAIGEAANAYAAHFQPVPPGEEAIGDGVLLKIFGNPLHLGMVIDPVAGLMLHVEHGAGAAIERYRDSLIWRRRIVGVYRVV